jgi:thioesterase domain-containing protein
MTLNQTSPAPCRSEDEISKEICELWSDLLDTDVDGDDDFFDVGGYSLLIVEIVAHARARGLDIEARDVFMSRTPRGVARRLRERSVVDERHQLGTDPGFDEVWASSMMRGPDGDHRSCLVELAPGDSRLEPLFVFHWGTGNVGYIAETVDEVAGGRSVYGLQSIGLSGRRRPDLAIEPMASTYLRAIREVQPQGTLRMLAPCAGGRVAIEIARQEATRGRVPALLTLVNVGVPGVTELDLGWGLRELYDFRLESLRHMTGTSSLTRAPEATLELLRSRGWIDASAGFDDIFWLQVVWAAGAFAQEHQEPRRIPGRIVVFDPTEDAGSPTTSWSELAQEVVRHEIPGATTLDVLRHVRFQQIFRELLSATSPSTDLEAESR